LVGTDIKLTVVYDLVLEMDERKDSIEVVCEFNHKLNGGKVRELLDQYLMLVTGIIEKYV
jgi:hypothetical protein